MIQFWRHLLILLWGGLCAAQIATAQTADDAFDRVIADARARMPAICGQDGIDRLHETLCRGTIRVGVRDGYPLFATQVGDTRAGYDIDVARVMADRLGVGVEWVPVRPATRISTLSDGAADMVIATMGHNTRRDGTARFIRPHYYRSETIIVGPRAAGVTGFDGLLGRTVCTTIGNYANATLIANDLRVMLFEGAARLPEALSDQTCQFVAHDDSFFASYLVDDSFAQQFGRKFGYDPVPWGIATSNVGSDELAHALDLLSQAMHRDGTFLELGQSNGIFTDFLAGQQMLWSSATCNDQSTLDADACLIAPLHNVQQPTKFAGEVDAARAWAMDQFGFAPRLPMLMTQPAWELFVTGIINSLILVIGALVATLAVALVVGFVSALPYRVTKFAVWVLVVTLQSSPVLLTIVVTTAIAHAMFTFSAAVALGAAIVALGLMNGVNAGQAIGEAAESLRREQGLDRGLSPALFAQAVRRSMSQILSFLVNAAKGTPVASFTGAPELLATLTDITSFASERAVTYSFVLVFYIVVVSVVVWGCNRVKARFDGVGSPPTKRDEQEAVA